MLLSLRCLATYFVITTAVVSSATTTSQQKQRNNTKVLTRISGSGSGSGCRDESTDSFQTDRNPNVAGCRGSWIGHISNASLSLCSYGWRVCGPLESSSLLKRFNWEDEEEEADDKAEVTTQVTPACYAINAPADHHHRRCRSCTNNTKQDDLVGVGPGCSLKSVGAKSCFSGSRNNVSCCSNEARFGRSCRYQPGLTTGVLCCRLPGTTPRIVVHPKRYTHAMVAGILVLSCRATGFPEPRIQWLHNGRLIGDRAIPRVSLFDSGYLIISDAQPSDSGRYQCLAANQVGVVTGTANVLVTEFPSGCADGTTDGLFRHEEIHACRGRWEGHVKRGRALCSSGWQVCNPRHSSLLKLLTWSESVETDGCYAYNAANSLNLCSPCYDMEMAGIGKHCGQIRSSLSSCLAEGRIDVHSDRSSLMKCNFTKGLTTGVLCCKRPHKWQQASQWEPPKCQRRCRNGGVCVDQKRCQCAQGYKGSSCQTPICPGGCIPNSSCVKPRLCRCDRGYSGPTCSDRDELSCPVACANGGRCVDGRCKCTPNYRGSSCRSVVQNNNSTSQANRTKPKN